MRAVTFFNATTTVLCFVVLAAAFNPINVSATKAHAPLVASVTTAQQNG